MSSQFVYVTYIRTTPEKLFEALTKPEFTQQYWYGITHESAWTVGAEWKMKLSDGRVTDVGEVLEYDPPRRLVLKWRNEFKPELKAEGFSRCVMEIEPAGEMVKLTINHSIDRDGAKIIEAVSGGWPKILSSLKSLLETGRPLA
jgi:uncharacterized protein YndB with AHSA1/START domain